MIELSNQVTSLEVSRRLKELGVKQESYFFHAEYYTVVKQKWEFIWGIEHILPMHTREKVSAYTVAELFYAMPGDINGGLLALCRGTNGEPIANYGISAPERDTNAADVLAKLLIHLLENNLITLEEINNKL